MSVVVDKMCPLLCIFYMGVRFATLVFVQGDDCSVFELLGHILFLPYAAEEAVEGVKGYWSRSLVDFCRDPILARGFS